MARSPFIVVPSRWLALTVAAFAVSGMAALLLDVPMPQVAVASALALLLVIAYAAADLVRNERAWRAAPLSV
ncbi:MAG: hypothetical protein H7255_07145, partial [Ramlibacter sp.]|nr:hypothetical protein [Ramlibacter sp.]